MYEFWVRWRNIVMSNFRVKRMTDKYFMNKCIDMRLDKTIAVSW